MLPLAQARNLTPPGLKIPMHADISGVIPQDGFSGFQGELTFVEMTQLPDKPFPGQG